MTNQVTRNAKPIPILVYHQIDNAPPKGQPFRSLYVAPKAFARQMALLDFLGYRGLSMSALLPYLSGEKSGKVVGLTFDDGYLNNLTHALPVLQRFGFSSTCYAVSALAGKTNTWDAAIGVGQTQLMNNVEMAQWVAGGQEIGSHTRSHVDLTAVAGDLAKNEIIAGTIDLQTVLQTEVKNFCYPFGRYRPEHVQMVAAGGYTTATTTNRGRCHAGCSMLELPRVPVLKSTSLPLLLLKIASGYEDKRSV
jgi:peptidoglycan/xylan/chitin deacetylase (PgdA/CDA1 family)